MKQAMWKCGQHGTFDAVRTAACPECFKLMRQALEVFAKPEMWDASHQWVWLGDTSPGIYAQQILDATQ